MVPLYVIQVSLWQANHKKNCYSSGFHIGGGGGGGKGATAPLDICATPLEVIEVKILNDLPVFGKLVTLTIRADF